MSLLRRLATPTAVACLVLAAASCGTKDEVAPTSASESPGLKAVSPTGKAHGPERSASTPTVADPFAKKPVRNDYDYIDTETDDGAVEAVEYFAETYRFGLETGDSSLFDELYAPECTTCIAMKRDIEDPSRRLSDVKWDVEESRIGKLSDNRIEASVRVAITTTLVGTGRTKDESIDIAARMEWRGEKWMAIDAEVKTQE